MNTIEGDRTQNGLNRIIVCTTPQRASVEVGAVCASGCMITLAS